MTRLDLVLVWADVKRWFTFQVIISLICGLLSVYGAYKGHKRLLRWQSDLQVHKKWMNDHSQPALRGG